MAAPTATASSGFTPLWGYLPKKFVTSSYTLGILVIPPTNKTSSIFSLEIPASFKQSLHGFIVFFKNSSVNDSSLALVKLMFRCLGPLASAVKYGKLISV